MLTSSTQCLSLLPTIHSVHLKKFLCTAVPPNPWLPWKYLREGLWSSTELKHQGNFSFSLRRLLRSGFFVRKPALLLPSHFTCHTWLSFELDSSVHDMLGISVVDTWRWATSEKKWFFFSNIFSAFSIMSVYPKGHTEMLDVLRPSWLILGKKVASPGVLWWVCDVIARQTILYGATSPFMCERKYQSHNLLVWIALCQNDMTKKNLLPFQTLYAYVYLDVCASVSISSMSTSSISTSSICMYVCIYIYCN